MIGTEQLRTIKAAASLPTVIAQSMPLDRAKDLFVGMCPFHREKTGSFYVWPDHYHCFGCGAHGDAIAWLMHGCGLTFVAAVAYLGGNSTITAKPIRQQRVGERSDEEARNTARAQKLWAEAAPPQGTIVEDYLRTFRHLVLPDEPVIRFHPACPCGSDRMPAMLALMSDPATGEPRGIHRTFLRPDGSGKISKMMLGQAGVIRLCERITDGLGLAEGIETALAVAQRVGWGPVWAAGSAGGIRSFPVLPMTTLNIFCDHDESGVGLKAARDCAQRWAAAARVALEQHNHLIELYIHLPPAGKDWDEATLGEDVL